MKITYNKAAIIQSADQVIHNAAGMSDDYMDVHNRTGVLLDDFGGSNAFNYAEHQTQFLQGFKHLIETVVKFGSTVHVVLESATATDMALAMRVPGV